MNGTDPENSMTQPEPANDVLADLFRQVPARKHPPAEDEQLIRQAIHGQWQAMTRGRRRRLWTWALAASIVLVVVTAVRFGPQAPSPGPAATVASIEKIVGTVTAFSTNGPVVLLSGATKELTIGDVMIGLTLRSGTASGAGLRWMNGTLVRLDENTELKVLSDVEIFLLSGRVYLDTLPGQTGGKAIIIRTPQGLVRHLGTQFMAQTSPSGLLISVREGEVMVQPLPMPHSDGQQAAAEARVGQQLRLSPNGKIELEPIPTWGDDWAWAEVLSPGFESDGRSLADLFSWAGRELGRQVEFTTPSAESVAATTVLHGNLDVQPQQVLSVATATSDLTTRLTDGLIVVTLTQGP
jgi:ferric-dicitrate binding protein FerR (iron transport regulator)